MAATRCLVVLLGLASVAGQALQDLYDFEAAEFDGWTNAGELDWSALTTATQSQGTGPVADHTTGSGEYVVVEASCGGASVVDGCSDRCPQGREAVLESPTFAEGTVDAVSFWYHMYGVGPPGETCDDVELFMGETFLQARNASGGLTLLWYKSSNQGNRWQYSGSLYLPSDAVQLRFTHRTGIHWASDAALDDIALFLTDRQTSFTLLDAPDDLLNGLLVPTNAPTPLSDLIGDGDDNAPALPLIWIIVIVVCSALLCILVGLYFQWSYIVRRCCKAGVEGVKPYDHDADLKISARDAHVLSFDNGPKRPGIQRASTSVSTLSKKRFTNSFDLSGEMKPATADRPRQYRSQSGRPALEPRTLSYGHHSAGRPSFELPGTPGFLPRPAQRFPANTPQREPRAARDLLAAMDETRVPERKLMLMRSLTAGSAQEGRYHFTIDELDAMLKKFPSASHRMDAISHLFGTQAAVLDEHDPDNIDTVLTKHFLVDVERNEMHRMLRTSSLQQGGSMEEQKGYTMTDIRE